MSTPERIGREDVDALVDVIERAIPELHAYLLRRCGVRAVAEDLTAEAVLAAVDHVNAGAMATIDAAYLTGIARHKLADHWRRQERERRHIQVFAGGRADAPGSDEAAERFEPGRASTVMAELNPMQRAALTLRYVDDLPVPEVARLIGRSVHATETLLVRAKRAFRARYAAIEEGLSS